MEEAQRWVARAETAANRAEEQFSDDFRRLDRSPAASTFIKS
jgi:hypothetical protein